MAVSFHYKGLSAEDRIYLQSPSQSARLAAGTLYEAWFDTLQTSPWYAEIAKTGVFPSESAEENWKNFGDLTGLTFRRWWLKTGYEIFAEKVDYRPIKEADLNFSVSHPETDDLPPILKLEIPLNLSRYELQAQFEKMLKTHDAYRDQYDRWEHSTARVHQVRETKITYGSIKRWLFLYRDWTKQKAENPDLTQYEYSLKNKLIPNAKKRIALDAVHDEKERAMFANALSDQLKLARNLMAHATEGVFPDVSPHRWAVSGVRSKRSEE